MITCFARSLSGSSQAARLFNQFISVFSPKCSGSGNKEHLCRTRRGLLFDSRFGSLSFSPIIPSRQYAKLETVCPISIPMLDDHETEIGTCDSGNDAPIQMHVHVAAVSTYPMRRQFCYAKKNIRMEPQHPYEKSQRYGCERLKLTTESSTQLDGVSDKSSNEEQDKRAEEREKEIKRFMRGEMRREDRRSGKWMY
eukprot:748196-Hanusia_phi.AAC.7